jgi:hypothetical protein
MENMELKIDVNLVNLRALLVQDKLINVFLVFLVINYMVVINVLPLVYSLVVIVLKTSHLHVQLVQVCIEILNIIVVVKILILKMMDYVLDVYLLVEIVLP